MYIGNRLLTNTVERKTPFELLNGKKPNVYNLVLYGSLCYVRIPDEKLVINLAEKVFKESLLVMMK